MAMLPHGTLVRLLPDGTTQRLSVPSPSKATFISAASAPWLAYTAGAAGESTYGRRETPPRSCA